MKIYAALSIAAFGIQYPGLLWHDALGQLIQWSHRASLDDWHSPGVTMLWSIGAPVFGQPASALLVQCLLIMLYPAVVIERAVSAIRRGGVTALASAAFALFSLSWISMAGLVVKDSLLLGMGSAILALASFYPGRPTWAATWTGALLLIGCLLVRPTNFILVGATAVIVAACYPASIPGKLKAIAISAAIAGVVTLASPPFYHDVLGAKDAHAADQLRIFDVAGISTETHADLFTQLPNWPASQVERPWSCYIPQRWDPFATWGRCEQYVRSVGAIREKYGDGVFNRWWLDAIWRHPVAYVVHRARYARELLTTSEYFVQLHPAYENTSRSGLANSFGMDVSREFKVWRNSPLKLMLNGLAKYLFNYRFASALALFACLFGLASSWRNRASLASGPALVVLLASAMGLSNALMLGLFGVGNDARYLMLTLCCGYAAGFELWLRHLNAQPAGASSAPLRSAPSRRS